MRVLAAAVLALLVFAAIPAPVARAETRLCGRTGYPDAGHFNAASVRDEGLWSDLRSHGGFANGTEGSPAEVTVDAPSATFLVRVEGIAVRRFIGGAETEVPVVALTVREAAPGGPVRATHAFRLVDLSRGGNLTLVAWVSGAALHVFWRWAYLPCDETFPVTYYVFHGQVESGGIADDNSLVYFETARPRGGVPAEMVLLITAGLSATVIFLLARHALNRGGARRETGDRTVK